MPRKTKEIIEEKNSKKITAKSKSTKATVTKKDTPKKATSAKKSTARSKKDDAVKNVATNSTTKKAVVTKSTAKESSPTATKTATKKSSSKATTIPKEPAKKAITKKATDKKTKTVAKKSIAKKAETKTKVAKKTTTIKAEPKTKVAKKTTTKKAEPKTNVAKKTTTKKAEPKTNVAKKTTTKKAETKTNVAKKAVTKKVKSKTPSTSKKSNVLEPEYYDLPYAYNQTVIKLLAQTPKTIFVYWELSQEDVNNFKNKYGENFFYNTIPVLSVYNEDKDYYFDVMINDYANSWYIHVPDEACKYKVTFKRVFKEQKVDDPPYVEIVTSNEIIIPNGHVLYETISNRVEYMNLHTQNKFFRIFLNRNHLLNQKFFEEYIDKYGLNNPSSNFGQM